LSPTDEWNVPEKFQPGNEEKKVSMPRVSAVILAMQRNSQSRSS
jgi:hypothetical protein